MRKIQEILVKLSYIGFTRTCGEVVVSECHVIPNPVNLIGCPVKCLGTANLVVKLSVTLLSMNSVRHGHMTSGHVIPGNYRLSIQCIGE